MQFRVSPSFIGRCIAAAGLVLLLTATGTAAPRPRLVADTVILAIGHFRPGCIPDTVWGEAGEGFTWRPLYITWGGADSLHTPPCPPGKGSRPRLAKTTFEYPTWPHLGISFSAEQRSLGDTLIDLVWHVWGAYPDSTDPHSTVRSQVVFGQSGLDSLATIDLASLPAYQTFPFFAMDLEVGTHLIEPDNRDLSGTSSYILLPIGGGPPPAPLVYQPAAVAWKVKLYPNPAAGSASIEGRPVPPGDYSVEVIATDGAVALRQQITVQETGELFGTLDLKSLPSGFYVVRLRNAGSDIRVGDFPIVKTR
jgi:hypothetical protein